MRRFGTMAVIGLLAVVMTGCSGLDYQKAKQIQVSGTGYDAELSRHYLELSKFEYKEGDYRYSDFFARRAMAAARGERFPPEEIGMESLPPESVAELRAARDKLVATQHKGAVEKVPVEAARAQAMFDCWIHEQAENWPFEQDRIAFCREQFTQAMAKVEAALQPPPPPPTPPPALPSSYLVFFDLDKAVLTAEARSIVATAAANAYKLRAPRIRVIGYTDRSGTAAYNLKLSERRAEAVKQALIELGARPEAIVTEGRGEDDPLVPTADGVPEPQNRRASILFE